MNYPFQIEPALLQKYAVAAPRYTSYPTAPVWKAGEFFEEKQNSLHKEGPLSLYFHLPFCPNHCYFCGCNVIITSNRSTISGYVEALGREIEQYAKIAGERPVVQLQWGGGSPSHLKEEEILWLMQKIKSSFHLSDDVETGIEINPQYTTESLLDAVKEAGFNRISLGIQDFDPEVQKIINRIQPYEKVEKVMQWLRSRFSGRSVNFDLIYGLPYQTRESFQQTLNQVLSLKPDRMALYNYAHVPWLKPLMRIFPQSSLVDAKTKMQIFLDSVQSMIQAGYLFLGLDHFALPEDSLAQAFSEGQMHRNFMGYTTHKGLDLLGLGITSISQLDGSFFQNTKKLSQYYQHLDSGQIVEKGHLSSEQDKLRSDLILRILCQNGFLVSEVEKQWNFDFQAAFGDRFDAFEMFRQDGLLRFDGREYRVTDLGRFFARNLCLPFDAYYRELTESGRPVFSQTV